MKYYSAISSLVKKHGVEANFIFHERVSYQDALKIQKNADVLLLMLWGDSARIKERGVIPAKLFEYIGVQRPVLGIGLNSIIAAEIVNKEKLGIVSNDPEVIAEQIKAWIAIKKQVGYIPDLPAKLNSGYTRNEQFKSLVEFLLQNVQ